MKYDKRNRGGGRGGYGNRDDRDDSKVNDRHDGGVLHADNPDEDAYWSATHTGKLQRVQDRGNSDAAPRRTPRSMFSIMSSQSPQRDANHILDEGNTTSTRSLSVFSYLSDVLGISIDLQTPLYLTSEDEAAMVSTRRPCCGPGC